MKKIKIKFVSDPLSYLDILSDSPKLKKGRVLFADTVKLEVKRIKQARP